MSLQRINRWVSGALVLLSGLSLGAHLLSQSYVRQAQEAQQRRYDANQALVQISQKSRALSAALQSYAATGDLRFRNEFQGELTTGIEWAAALEYLRNAKLASNELLLFDRVQSQANDLLVMAAPIIEATQRGRLQAARDLAYGLEYRHSAVTLMEQIAQLHAEIERRLNDDIERLSQRAAIASVASLVLLLIQLVLFGAVMYGFFSRRLVAPLMQLTRDTEKLVAGNFDVDFGFQSDRTEIGNLARALERYRKTSSEVEQQRWVKAGLTELSTYLQRAETLEEFSSRVCSLIAPMLGTGGAALYVCDGQSCTFSGGWGVDVALLRGRRFEVGQSLLGQAALENKPLVVKDLPAGYPQLVSGLGESAPSVLVLVPIQGDHEPMAVLEFALFGHPNDRQWALLKELPAVLAPRLAVLQRTLHTHALLASTQEQSSQLQLQTDQLARQAAELETRQARIKATEAWYRGILESAPIGMLVVDSHGVITLSNVSIERAFGYSPGELIGKPVEVLVPTASRERHVGLRNHFLAGTSGTADGQITRELMGQRKDGSLFPVELILGHLPTLDGRGPSVCASVRDISERKMAAEALAQVSLEQTAILEAASMGIVLLKDRHIVRCNPGLDHLMGYEPGEQVGQSTRIWYPDDQTYESLGSTYAEMAAGKTVQIEHVLVRKDGSQFWCRLSGSAIDTADMSKGVVLLLEDVTDAHEAARVLEHAREAAEEATRLKSDFLANMSHEIRTPMNAIIGMAHLALKTDLTPRQRDYIHKVQMAGQHLLGLINDILDFSKLEAGKMSIENAEFQLSEIRDSVLSLLGEKAASKGLALTFETDPHVPPWLVGDALRVGQVLINIVNNAVKFTEHGQVSVQVSLRELREGQVLLHFSVKDTGIGLTPEQIGHLFKSFQQADASTTRKYGGTGLGLSISKKLVELMGGQVGVDSLWGHGSDFWFTVPLGIGLGRVEKPRWLAADMRQRRVLVVDDQDSDRMVLCDQLRGMGFQVSEARSGEDAVEMVQQAHEQSQHFALVFLDWRMPRMDGLETARRLQAVQRDAPMRFIMVTAYGREEVLRQADAAGIEDVLIKPVNNSVLFDTAMRALGADVSEERYAQDTHSVMEQCMTALFGARILVVEDNELNQEVAAELLRQVGLEVGLAENGQVALDKLRKGTYDLVLMDMQMPVMDGLTATREIRRHPEWANLPVVAMTANAMQQDRQRCLDAGMNDFVAKPIEPDELWAALLRSLKPKSGNGNGLESSGVMSVAPVVAQPVAASAVALAQGPLVWPDLQGLDTESGLRRTLGKPALYLSFLRKFHQTQPLAARDLAAALDAGDWAVAERLAHTAKSVAGNIGATEVQAAAAALERALREHEAPEQVRGLLQSYESRLQAVLEGLSAWLAQVPADPAGEGAAQTPVVEGGAGTAQAETVERVEAQLKALLADDDMDATRVLREHQALLQSAWGHQYESRAALILNFDFERALQSLQSGAQRVVT